MEIVLSFCNIAETSITYVRCGYIRKACVLSSLHVYLKDSAAGSICNTMIEKLLDGYIEMVCKYYEHTPK